VCAAAEQSISIIQQEPERRMQLHRGAKFLRDQFAELGIKVLAGSVGPIVPIAFDDAQRAVELATRLEERGFLVGAIRPPTVPRGTSRLRISVSVVHEEKVLADLAQALGEVLNEV
jgi:8-amino-7-oxononanoate synthase